jgi:hypothetical protein
MVLNKRRLFVSKAGKENVLVYILGFYKRLFK